MVDFEIRSRSLKLPTPFIPSIIFPQKARRAYLKPPADYSGHTRPPIPEQSRPVIPEQSQQVNLVNFGLGQKNETDIPAIMMPPVSKVT